MKIEQSNTSKNLTPADGIEPMYLGVVWSKKNSRSSLPYTKHNIKLNTTNPWMSSVRVEIARVGQKRCHIKDERVYEFEVPLS